MPKAIVVPTNTEVSDTVVVVSYAVSLLGPPHSSFGSFYTVNTGVGVAANLLAWRNKVIVEAAERGLTLAVSDVIVFGAPS